MLTNELGLGALNSETALMAGTLDLRDMYGAMERMGRVCRDVRVPITLTVREAMIAATALMDKRPGDADPDPTSDDAARARAGMKLSNEAIQAINRHLGRESTLVAENLAKVYAATPAPPEPEPVVTD
jgi:hypothetical protein